MRKYPLTVLLVLMIIFMTACSSTTTVAPYETHDFVMGTVVIQRIYHENAENISTQVLDRIRGIEDSMTINKAGGEINRLNEAAGKGYADLSDDTLYVLEKAAKFSTITEGAFDVSVGPLVKEWGIFTDSPNVPSKERISGLLELVDYSDIIIDKTGKKAKLQKREQIVDVGGIAKGFAGDEALDIYREQGVKSAFISLGGNVVALGGKPDGSAWKIGVRNPRGPEGSYIGILSVKDKAVVSSGDYERYFEKDGVRYHHILSPKTGYPADSGLIGTTIVSDISIDADALSTAAFVLGLEKGTNMIENLEGVEAIFITSDKKIYLTKGLENVFDFDDESKEYEYVEKR